MKTPEIYRIIENNKPDSFTLMDPDMKKALAFDLDNFKKIQREFPHLKNDEKAIYDVARRVWNENPPEIFAKEDIVLDGPYGKLPFRFYRSDEKKNKPCIIFFMAEDSSSAGWIRTTVSYPGFAVTVVPTLSLSITSCLRNSNSPLLLRKAFL